MMILIIKDTGETTTPEKLHETHSHIMCDYSDLTFAAQALEESGLAIVTMPDQPVFDSRLQRIEPINIAEEDGVYSGQWSEPELIEGVTREDIVQLIAEKRWLEEVNAVVSHNGYRFPTDEKTQAKFAAVYMKAKADASLTVPAFESLDGFVELSNDDIIAIGDMIYRHVQDTFARKKQLLETEGATHLDW